MYRSLKEDRNLKDPRPRRFTTFSRSNYVHARMAYLIQWNEPLTSLFSRTTTRSRNTTDHTHTRTHTSVNYTHAERVYARTPRHRTTHDRAINLILWLVDLASTGHADGTICRSSTGNIFHFCDPPRSIILGFIASAATESENYWPSQRILERKASIFLHSLTHVLALIRDLIRAKKK